MHLPHGHANGVQAPLDIDPLGTGKGALSDLAAARRKFEVVHKPLGGFLYCDALAALGGADQQNAVPRLQGRGRPFLLGNHEFI